MEELNLKNDSTDSNFNGYHNVFPFVPGGHSDY
jgi:hypothetical protein